MKEEIKEMLLMPNPATEIEWYIKDTKADIHYKWFITLGLVCLMFTAVICTKEEAMNNEKQQCQHNREYFMIKLQHYVDSVETHFKNQPFYENNLFTSRSKSVRRNNKGKINSITSSSEAITGSAGQAK